MAKSGYTDVKVTNWDTLRFNWSIFEQNQSRNFSVVHWSLYLNAGADGYIGSSATKIWKVIINGTTYQGTNSVGVANNESKYLASGSLNIYHNANGTKSFSYSFSQQFDITFSGAAIGTISGSGTGVLDTIARQAVLNTAPNFNDEENPTIKYTNPLGADAYKLRACISLTGSAPDIAYRDVPKTENSYTFELTEAERNILRNATRTSESRTVKFYLVTEYKDGTGQTSILTRTFTVVNADPVMEPTAVDTNTTTLGLTNNGNRIISGYSNVAYNFNASALKGASITSYKVTCGSKSATTASGTLTGADGADVVFTLTDSRGKTTTKTLNKTLYKYVPLTATSSNMFLNADGELTFTMNGNFYNGTFGNTNNSVTIRYRTLDSTGKATSWVTVTPTFSGNTYSSNITITGLDYTKSYKVRIQAVDALKSIVFDSDFVSSIPVFDWDKNDFNFNVPVNMPSLSVNGRDLGSYKILWEGFDLMDLDDYTVTLSEPISAQPNGIILVFSLVNTSGAAQNASWQSFYKSKGEVAILRDLAGNLPYPNTFLLGINSGFSVIGAKYLYFTDTMLGGNPTNGNSGANSGISFNNGRFALRYVLGV